MTFLDLAERVLEDAKRPLRAVEIWDLLSKKEDFFNKMVPEHRNNKERAMADFNKGACNENSNYEIVDENVIPHEYILKKKGNIKISQSDFILKFKDLVGAPTRGLILEAINKNEAEWDLPNVVAFASYKNKLELGILGLDNLTDKANFYISFSTSRYLNSSNYKEQFFKACSNSYWAEYSYFIIEKDSTKKIDIFFDGLENLTKEFGIGVILFSTRTNETEVLFKALNKKMCPSLNDKLFKNNEFKKFMKRTESY